MNKAKLWTLCRIAVGILIILTFTPVITPQGSWKPMLMGMPYTLWMGIIHSFLLVGLTWLGTRVHPGN